MGGSCCTYFTPFAFASSPAMHCLVVLDFKLVPLPFARYLSTSFSDAHNAPIDVIEQCLERPFPFCPHFAHGSGPGIGTSQRGMDDVFDGIALAEGKQGHSAPSLAWLASKRSEVVSGKFAPLEQYSIQIYVCGHETIH